MNHAYQEGRSLRGKSGLFMAILLTLFLAASPCPARKRDPPKDIIRFAVANSNYESALNRIIGEYEKANPHITVELSVIGVTGFQTWIRSRMAAGGEMVPDIYNANFTIGFDREGKWITLDDYYDAINPYTGKRWRDGLDMTQATRLQYAGNYYHLAVDYVEISIFYNRDIFDSLGLSEPETWEEFLATCGKIREAGYVPIAMAGDAQAFWESGFGWLVRMFCDAYIRNIIPLVASRPGDFDYDPSRNADYEYDPTDPFSDMMVVVNMERLLNAIKEGDLDFRSDRIKRIYSRLKELSQHF